MNLRIQKYIKFLDKLSQSIEHYITIQVEKLEETEHYNRQSNSFG